MWIYVNLSVHGGGYFTFFTFLLISRGSRSVEGWRLFVPHLFSGCPGRACDVTSPGKKLDHIYTNFQRSGSVCKNFGPEKVPSKKPQKCHEVEYMTFLIFWLKMENNFQAKDWLHLICGTTPLREFMWIYSIFWEFMWTYVNLCEFMWINVNLCEFMWIFVNFCEFMWIYVNFREFMWSYVNLCEFMCIHVNLCGFMWIYVNLCAFTWIHVNSC